MVGTEGREVWAENMATQQNVTKEAFLSSVCKRMGILAGRWATMDEVSDAPFRQPTYHSRSSLSLHDPTGPVMADRDGELHDYGLIERAGGTPDARCVASSSTNLSCLFMAGLV